MAAKEPTGPDLNPDNPPLNKNLGEAKKKFVYFWRECDVFSQWYQSKFTLDGIDFLCAEQYMMYTKAVLLHDDELAVKILRCRHPAAMKKLGRQTQQYSEEFWRQQCLHVVKAGNKAKFSQNEDLLQKLFSTYPKILVEASPYDTIWGIGLRKDDQAAWNEATWEGLNLLGFILTEVRDELMFEKDLIPETDKKVYFDILMSQMTMELANTTFYDRVYPHSYFSNDGTDVDKETNRDVNKFNSSSEPDLKRNKNLNNQANTESEREERDSAMKEELKNENCEISYIPTVESNNSAGQQEGLGHVGTGAGDFSHHKDTQQSDEDSENRLHDDKFNEDRQLSSGAVGTTADTSQIASTPTEKGPFESEDERRAFSLCFQKQS